MMSHTPRRTGGVVPWLLALSLTLGTGAAAAQGIDRDVIIVRQGSVAEAAVSACAGGAAIGVLIVWVSGTGAAVPTAGLFCGLSVAATVSAAAASQAWRSLGGLFP